MNRPQKKTPGAAAPKATAESTKPAKPISISELGKLPKTDTAVPKLMAAIAQHGSATVLAELVKFDWLQRSIVAGARKLVDLLLTHGIDADVRSSDVATVSRSPGPLSALMLSDKWSTAEICELVPRLLAAGASPDRLHPDLRICNPERINECYSALDHAYRRGKPEIVELLLPAVKEQVTLVSTTVMALLDVRPARN